MQVIRRRWMLFGLAGLFAWAVIATAAAGVLGVQAARSQPYPLVLQTESGRELTVETGGYPMFVVRDLDGRRVVVNVEGNHSAYVDDMFPGPGW